MKLKMNHWLKSAAAILAALLVLQFVYSLWACGTGPDPNFKPDLVLVYGGQTQSSEYGIDLARRRGCPLYISETVWKLIPLRGAIAAMGSRVTVDPRAFTTDQNARYSAPFIRNGGYRNIALVCAWHHEPRALFLSRLYLLGSGVRFEPYPSEPAPPFFGAKPVFWLQMINFWGSLGRVVLDLFGIDDWPRPQLIAT